MLGPGAANNSTLGGSLITTIAFGVPASVIMAILLGAFIIQGIVPGPRHVAAAAEGPVGSDFFLRLGHYYFQHNHRGVCFLFLKPLAKVTQVRGAIIIPIILMLIYLGAFAEKNAFEDMLIVLLFGGLGWIMEKMEWPRPPVLLGLVLGPLAENRLFLSTDNYGAAWLAQSGRHRDICAITLFGIFYPMIKNRREEKEKLASEPKIRQLLKPLALADCASATKRSLASSSIVYTCLALYQSRNFGYRAGLFPWVIGIPTLLLCLAQLARELWGKEKPKGGSCRLGKLRLTLHPKW